VPIGDYYGGRGEKVAREMRKRYGKRWREVFYAKANKSDLKPGTDKNRKAAIKAAHDDAKRKRRG
jgi:hypothetical protein